jgi:hypothetical protein
LVIRRQADSSTTSRSAGSYARQESYASVGSTDSPAMASRPAAAASSMNSGSVNGSAPVAFSSRRSSRAPTPPALSNAIGVPAQLSKMADT